MHNFKQSLFYRHLKSFSFIFAIYSVFRAVFFIYQSGYFEELSAEEALKGFVHGLRFDSHSIALANIASVILILIPSENLNFKRFKATIFTLCNTLVFSFLIINLEYFSFTKKHLYKDAFSYATDLKKQWLFLITDYVPLTILFGLIIFIFYRVQPFNKNSRHQKTTLKHRFFSFIFFAALSFLAIRGGTQEKPLSIGHAYVFEKSKISTLALNSAFTFIRSKKSAAIPNFLIPESSEVYSRNKTKKSIKPLFTHPKKQNVIILIMESFALEYFNLDDKNKDSFAPFTLDLAKKGLFLKNNFANGRRSIDIGPSIFCSIPNLLHTPFVRSSFQQNDIIGLPKILNGYGYSTSFFHGTANNSMFFDSFMKRIGFENYFGLDNYPSGEDYNGVWGIYDEAFFDFALKKVETFKKPFMMSFFSLSSHPPYIIPEKHQNKFPKGELAIFESIGYADFALKKFMESASETSWYENTLFIVTGDHAFKSVNPKFQNTLGNFKVPLILFHPKYDLTRFNADKITQHLDITPSILDFLNIKTQTHWFGSSVFRDHDAGVAWNRDGEILWELNKHSLVSVMPDGSTKSQKHDQGFNIKESSKTEKSTIPRALKNYFWRLKNNALSKELKQ